MKFPKDIPIRGIPYRVLFIAELEESKAGMCYMDDKAMLISTEQSRAETLATFCHEWAHAVEREYSVKLGHAKIQKLEYALAELLTALHEHWTPKRKR